MKVLVDNARAGITGHVLLLTLTGSEVALDLSYPLISAFVLKLTAVLSFIDLYLFKKGVTFRGMKKKI